MVMVSLESSSPIQSNPFHPPLNGKVSFSLRTAMIDRRWRLSSVTVANNNTTLSTESDSGLLVCTITPNHSGQSSLSRWHRLGTPTDSFYDTDTMLPWANIEWDGFEIGVNSKQASRHWRDPQALLSEGRNCSNQPKARDTMYCCHLRQSNKEHGAQDPSSDRRRQCDAYHIDLLIGQHIDAAHKVGGRRLVVIFLIDEFSILIVVCLLNRCSK